MSTRIIVGDALACLAGIPDGAVRCCVTSPPYWGLRDYGVDGQLGLERTPQEYVAAMVAVFADVRRVLADDGTLWLNLGDCYTPVNRGEQARPRKDYPSGLQAGHMHSDLPTRPATIKALASARLKPKDLVGIPWRTALALQDDGWWLREDIVWHKKNGMPESVTDRCTRSHEYIFHLAKSARYYHDATAIAEPATCQDPRQVDGYVPKSDNGKHAGAPQSAGVRKTDKQRGHSRRHAGFNDRWDAMNRTDQCAGTRNARSVWRIAATGYREAHFATFPPEIPRRCILAGSAPGDTVLDPFAGAGTTILVADRLNRHGIGIELNPDYAAMAKKRIADDAPLFYNEV